MIILQFPWCDNQFKLLPYFLFIYLNEYKLSRFLLLIRTFIFIYIFRLKHWNQARFWLLCVGRKIDFFNKNCYVLYFTLVALLMITRAIYIAKQSFNTGTLWRYYASLKWVIIGSGNGLLAPSHYLKQGWLIVSCESLIEIQTFSMKKMHFKMSSAKWQPFCLGLNVSTHWGGVTHICVGKSIIIGSDNGSSPDRRQAIIWTNVGILLVGALGTNVCEILI